MKTQNIGKKFIETTYDEYERIKSDWDTGININKEPCVKFKTTRCVPKSTNIGTSLYGYLLIN